MVEEGDAVLAAVVVFVMVADVVVVDVDVAAAAAASVALDYRPDTKTKFVRRCYAGERWACRGDRTFHSPSPSLDSNDRCRDSTGDFSARRISTLAVSFLLDDDSATARPSPAAYDDDSLVDVVVVVVVVLLLLRLLLPAAGKEAKSGPCL